MKKLIIAATMLATPGHAETILNQPSFYEAATVFLTGHDTGPLPSGDDMYTQPGWNNGAFPGDTVYYKASATPCLMFEFQESRPWGVRTWNFNFMASPQTAYGETGQVIDFGENVMKTMNRRVARFNENDLPVEESIRIATHVTFMMVNPAKQLMALQYIRDNFCPGLPEPTRHVNPY